MDFTLSALVGLAAGVLTSWGVGGGSLLMVYMTAVRDIAQHMAQGMNLIYFIPTSISAVCVHMKNRLVNRGAALPAIAAGVPMTIAAAIIAAKTDTELLRKIFGVFLVALGTTELLSKR